MNLLSWSLLSVFMISCLESEVYKSKNFTEVRVGAEGRDIMIPQELRDHLDQKLEQGWKTKTRAEFERPKIRFPVTVHVTEKNLGVLGKRSFRFKLMDGGGTLDFSKYITEGFAGTFFVGFDLEIVEKEMKENMDRLMVYYLSNAKKRTLFDGEYGSGCGNFFDVTSDYKEKMQKKGYVVNTNEGRYVSSLAGSFLFIVPTERKVYISQVTIRDAKHPQFLCR